MSGAVVIGIGNSFRRDDGVGPAVAEEVARRDLPGVRVLVATGEPGALLDAWSGVGIAIVVDAAMGDGASPGRIRRWTPDENRPPRVVSSHAIGLPEAFALGEALGQLPDRLVGFSVDIVDAGHGVGMTADVAAAIPGVVDAVLAELDHSM
ncbi:peptidase M52 [Mycobacterium sp. E136]|uniref:hydrogenase maturation protease n=1 Tax=Mycobacterium sp. E136 TaxID=1834125 RepID=UPI0007FD43B7|nr:hydrogenase maturation protease [Mycobacterium sp. E136]OBH01806.1 peptidase M52 [Mycobacterium sp. E136]